jgi:hypothetical protein
MRQQALRTLAMLYPTMEDVGFMWKNPLNPKSRGIRWTKTDLAKFRQYQNEYK